MIEVSELLLDPDFCDPFTVLRSSGTFAPGGYENTTTSVQMYGACQPADPQTLQMVPEGDRVEGAKVFWSTQEIFETRAEGVSDQIQWLGQMYRISRVWPWGSYWKAYGVGMAGR